MKIEFPEPFEYMNGTFVAEDTGNAIKGSKIDIYFDSVKVAMNFGKRDVKVTILK